MKKILFAASECVPFIKTGGLADVVGALPKSFDKKEWDVRVVMPNYAAIPAKFRNAFHYVTHFYMGTGSYNPGTHVGIMTYEYEGITYYFIDNLDYYGGEKPYADTRTDIEKFSFFSKAVLAILPVVNFQPDLIHCHDWQTGLIPVYLKNEFSSNPFFQNIRTVMTIHNLQFQGVWDIRTMKGITGFPDSLFTPDKLEYNHGANMLKGGLVYADYITTVSETYAQEIQTEYYGEGLDGLLRARHCDMKGIVNGIDNEAYNPQTDKALTAPFTAQNFRTEKVKNKLALQRELGLPVDENKFLIGLVSRLTDQKGLDLISCVMEEMVDEHTQFVIIGTGDERYESMFRYYAQKYPQRVSANICYADKLARKLYASADAFLMPSRFEPCGLTQLIAFRYGTVPIVRETGGLKDTVQPVNEYTGEGNGFSFSNYNAHEMLHVVNYAKHIYFDEKILWNKLIEQGITKDFSWDVSRQKYEELYRWLIEK
ncbi:MAG: glycogen synthase GlgA [Oscillospiraceae bacterium]|nr:glycogen synthase GlgA [Oscillospiraceae bacterium]